MRRLDFAFYDQLKADGVDEIFTGGSSIVDPSGKVVASAAEGKRRSSGSTSMPRLFAGSARTSIHRATITAPTSFSCPSIARGDQAIREHGPDKEPSK